MNRLRDFIFSSATLALIAAVSTTILKEWSPKSIAEKNKLKAEEKKIKAETKLILLELKEKEAPSRKD